MTRFDSASNGIVHRLSLAFVIMHTVLCNGAKRQARYVMRCNEGKNALKYSKLVAPVPFKRPTHPSDWEYILYRDYLTDCDLDRACVTDLVTASEKSNDAYVYHYLQPGTTFYLPAYSKSPYTWLVKNVFTLFEKYNASAKDFTFVHVNDETNNWNHPALIQFYNEWKTVYRQHWHTSNNYTALSEVLWTTCMIVVY